MSNSANKTKSFWNLPILNSRAEKQKVLLPLISALLCCWFQGS